MELREVFTADEVARLYAYRPPYPPEVFAHLRGLLVEPQTILDLGAGTGALAREMADFAKRVDAIDPSAAMVRAGQQLPKGRDERIRWIVGPAESAPLSETYGLIACGASLHWMNLDATLPRIRAALAPGAVVAVIDTEYIHGSYWDEVLKVIRGYSELETQIETQELMHELETSGGFEILGEERTSPMRFNQSVDDYIASLHSTSTLARVRLGNRSEAFDSEMRAVFARRRLERLSYCVVGTIIWGRPE